MINRVRKKNVLSYEPVGDCVAVVECLAAILGMMEKACYCGCTGYCGTEHRLHVTGRMMQCRLCYS